MVRKHTHCRLCQTELPAPFLSLGEQPLANALAPDEFHTKLMVQDKDRRIHDLSSIPLAVTLCTSCGLSQLTVVVDPKILYAGYRFRSGASETWEAHCEALAESFAVPGRVLDVAANDGTCINAFQQHGWEVVGIDPSPAHPNVIQAWWPCAVDGYYDLIVAQNVLGHVDNPIEFLTACEQALAPKGQILVEVPHVRDLITSCAFDTIYHEHLSYWSTGPILTAARKSGLWLKNVERLATHGGSRRYWLERRPGGVDNRGPVRDIDPAPYYSFAAKVETRLDETVALLNNLCGRTIWGYGASAKATVVLNALKAHGNTVWPSQIIDDTSEKQGRLMPGVHIPIVEPPPVDWDVQGRSNWDSCDVLWLLSWNNADALKARARSKGFTGRFLVTHPDLTLG